MSSAKGKGRVYNARQVAEIFERTPAWVYWCIANGKFVYENGEPIKPARVSPGGGRRRYDLDGVQEMAMSLYRTNLITDAKLKKVMSKIVQLRAEEEE